MRTAALLLVSASLVFGCSCVQSSQPQAFRSAKAVFDGIVEDIHYFDPENKPGGGVRVLVTFAVAHVWKGEVPSIIKVHAWEHALMCDSFLFEIGKRYIVYAVEQDKEGGWADKYPAGTRILAVGNCILRILEGEKLAGELKKLGKSKQPHESAGNAPVSSKQ